MNTESNRFQGSEIPVMDDATRMAYLDAMGIVSWQSKASEIVEGVVESNLNQTQDSAENVASDADVALDLPSVNDLEIETAEEVIEVDLNKNVKNSKTNPATTAVAQQYLKVVDWNNQLVKEEGAKSILIICRHEVEQPASSFARVNTPSRFMTDYISALTALNEAIPFEIKIKLAHLTEAGLGSDCVSLSDVLQNLAPDLVLLLGDETVSQLLDGDYSDGSVDKSLDPRNKPSVAGLRGRLVNLKPSQDALVSYHPFSLIENPSLKSLAQKDLIGLVKFLSQKQAP